MFQILLYVLFILLLWFIMKNKTLRKEPPLYPGALPILGHALNFLGSPIDTWEELKSVSDFSLKKGGVAQIKFGPIRLYFVTDPDDFLTISNKCLDKGYVYEFAKPWVGTGLVTSDVPTWKKNRKLFRPAFTQKALNYSLNTFNMQARRLVNDLKIEVGKGKFDHCWYIINNLLETVHQTTLGLKFENSNMINKIYVEDIDTLFDSYIMRIKKVWLHLTFFYNRSEMKSRQDKIIKKAKETSYAIIQERKSEIQEPYKYTDDQNDTNNKTTTILDLILEHSLYDEKFSDEDIRQHLETFTLASFDTTSTTLIYVLKLLGSHQTAQERLYKEIEEVFGRSDRDVEKDDLPKLIYLEAVAKETIRLYPVIPLIVRTACNDVELKNYTLPSGSAIVCSIFGVNHHPAWGQDVAEFKPERWLEDKYSSAAASRFAGFSLGSRNCLGARYALTVIKTNIVHIIRHYRIIADDSKMAFKFNCFLKPVSGHHIALESRS